MYNLLFADISTYLSNIVGNVFNIMVASSTSSPPNWPEACSAQYSPVRVIGTGGFGSVWMANRRYENSKGSDSVAIKVVGNDTYAQREVKILYALSQSQVQHPNIIRLLQDFPGEDGIDHFIVLSLARGPTLQYILKKEGGFGFKIAQALSKQLVSAIAFLHGHAIIHRDISPANLIVSGSALQDPNYWRDDFDIDGKVMALTAKCHITLIDFGFAIGKNIILMNIVKCIIHALLILYPFDMYCSTNSRGHRRGQD